MATSFRKTQIQAYPRVGEKITRDTLYWKNLEFPITRKEHGSINSIDFMSTAPYHFAVTSSTRVQVFSKQTNQPWKIFSKFKDLAYSGTFRKDGKLLVAGSEEGQVKMFDIQKKALLRSFKGHKGPTRLAKFTWDNQHILSGSDDKLVKIWDIPSESELISYAENQDYVRCGCVSKASKDMVLTGSYDHTVKLFDIRSPSSVTTVDHGHPVESVLMYPTGGLFLSAGGNVIKVWDALAGGRLLTSFSNHHKTITSMCFACQNQRLLSGSLDRHVKIYDISTYQVVHTLDYPSAVLSVGVSPDESVVVAGMSDGLLSIQHRKSEDEAAEMKRKKASFRHALKAKTYTPTEEDHVVQHTKKEKLSSYDKYFKKFQHSKALEAALDPRVRSKTPEVTVSVMQELIRRGGIKSALAGKDEKSLGFVLKFIQRNISNPKYITTLLDVSNIILDLYAEQIGQSSSFDELLLRLKETVDKECSYMKLLMQTMGTMDTIFAASQTEDNTEELDLGTIDANVNVNGGESETIEIS